MNALEAAYKNATFDYLEDNDTHDNTQDFNEAIHTTEDFLENLDYNFYDKK
ncbi:hypothetical protein MOV58_05890 [Staphylococcus hominis]|uniref:hypothetical protein n=1 Tax=Staphylococcus hominis TaxID=1290 RepID=UPI001F56EE1B|nr:hypothetical protein [Staphylococcus hominis]MCI2852880.1 hypothetical protein [Staphylococcus hominis]UNQ69109.1 hypothetical protein MOV58_05890 [Staphylococcus hominis]